jgi:hypothetical protein
VFVPLAVLFSLVGLLSGAAYRSATGVGASIVGIALSALGFFSSPSLLLLTAGMFAASQTNDGARDVSPNSEQSLPDQENRFCEITSEASKRYFRISQEAKKARDDKNGILEERAQTSMNNEATNRNKQILELVQQTSFSFDGWGVQLLKIDTPVNNRITFSVRPLCSNIVTMHLTGPANAHLLETLASKQVGDRLIVSGTFMASRDEKERPISLDPNYFERSLTQLGSMNEPEYRAMLR